MLMRLLNEKDSLSMMRFLCLVSMIFAGLIALYGLLRGVDLVGLSALCGVFVTASIGGKAVQKNIEIKAQNIEKVE